MARKLITLVELYAGNNNKEYSKVSLKDLMVNCEHKYEGTFTYGSGNTVTLTDQNAYFEFRMSTLQKRLDVNINDINKTVEHSNEGKVWVVAPSKKRISTDFYVKVAANVKAGEIYTIDRSGYVDLGIEGLLWADKNLGATTITGLGNRYAWGETSPISSAPYKFGTYPNYSKYNETDGIKTLDYEDDAAYQANNNNEIPFIDDIKYLGSLDENFNPVFDWEFTTNYNNTNVAGWICTKKKSNEIYAQLFFPIKYDASAPSYENWAFYWSATLEPVSDAFGLSLDTQGHYHTATGGGRQNGCYIRPVRDCSSYFGIR